MVTRSVIKWTITDSSVGKVLVVQGPEFDPWDGVKEKQQQ